MRWTTTAKGGNGVGAVVTELAEGGKKKNGSAGSFFGRKALKSREAGGAPLQWLGNAILIDKAKPPVALYVAALLLPEALSLTRTSASFMPQASSNCSLSPVNSYLLRLF